MFDNNDNYLYFEWMQLAIKTLSKSWQTHLSKEWKADYMNQLESFLSSKKKSGAVIYPCEAEYFSAFNLTPFRNVKVVILGQDPYHGQGQAHGLSFSVKPGVKIPPSLVNIYKELQSDLNIKVPENGFLKSWAEQGVLLLNATLSVEAGKAGSHQKKGWETFTDKVINILNDKKTGIVFMLWGSYAQKKGSSIDRNKHLVLEAPHPSPLSAYRGFLGCKHFSKANQYLQDQNLSPVNWAKNS